MISDDVFPYLSHSIVKGSSDTEHWMSPDKEQQSGIEEERDVKMLFICLLLTLVLHTSGWHGRAQKFYILAHKSRPWHSVEPFRRSEPLFPACGE